ncbi:UBX domain-containing protein 4 isoform X2 [Brachionichthys hirsutus]|uniref:UBX domain-containing protein 4 isoform X2 n=1 Tax=Brachionichthys hirsutus TaxID=412623 RepID=UPI003604982F
MLWFESSIPDAINLAKARSCVFVVVITGEDDQSAQLMSSWEDDTVSEAARTCCVAIKVDAKSEACVQFSQIYPVVVVPSSFFIGDNGLPLEVIAGSVSAEDLMKRISRVKQMCAQQVQGGAASSEPSPLVASGPLDNMAAEPAPAFVIQPAATEPTGKRNDGSISSTATPSESASSGSHPQPETKVERVARKLEEKQEQKKMGEEENKIKKEIERRKVGKDMQDFKRKQDEEKTKRLLEERNREKAEEKAARERVKQQIALDRAERAARYDKTQGEEKAAKLAQLRARQAEQEVRKEALVRERSTITRIQFRLPDGSSFTKQFPSQSRLQESLDFVVQEVGNRYNNFSLATMFPRREFTNEDLNKTLQELDLAPSASIVLLPRSSRLSGTVALSSGRGIWTVLGSLLYPLLAVWRFLSSFLFATPPPRETTSTVPAQRSGSHPGSTFSKAKRENPSKPSPEDRPKGFKKDGKICRFQTQEDSEEDNNTWNGNSTQQM